MISAGKSSLEKFLEKCTSSQKVTPMLNVEQFVRKPLYVEAVQVTQENLEEVAHWCGGEVFRVEPTEEKPEGDVFIKVNVKFPMDEEQTKARYAKGDKPGDWVLRSGNRNFKVYTDRAVGNVFSRVTPAPISS